MTLPSSGATSSTATLVATVDRRFGSAGKVQPEMVGTNGEGWRSSTSRNLWASTGHFISAASALKLHYLRLPGGTTVNYWDWTTGKFVKSSGPRPGIVAGLPKIGFTLDQWLDVCAALAVEPMFQLNLISIPARLAAGGTAYFVRGARNAQGALSANYQSDVQILITDQLAMLSHAITYMQAKGTVNGRNWSAWTPKYIELGNEVYLGGVSNPGPAAAFLGGTATGAQNYAYAASVMSQAIRSQSWGATVRIAACGTLGGFNRTWQDTLCNSSQNYSLLSFIDGFTFHRYPSLSLAPTTDANVATILESVVSQYSTFNNFATSPTPGKTTLPSGKTAWYTEYNFPGTSTEAAAMAGHWAHGLAVTLMTLTHIDDPLVEMTGSHALVGPAGVGDPLAHRMEAPSGTAGATATFTIKPTGWAQAILSRAAAGAVKYRKLTFNPSKVSGSTQFGLAGAAFQDGSGVWRAVIMNANSTAFKVTLPWPFNGSMQGTQIAAGISDTSLSVNDGGWSGVGSNGLNLPAYSLTYMTGATGGASGSTSIAGQANISAPGSTAISGRASILVPNTGSSAIAGQATISVATSRSLTISGRAFLHVVGQGSASISGQATIKVPGGGLIYQPPGQVVLPGALRLTANAAGTIVVPLAAPGAAVAAGQFYTVLAAVQAATVKRACILQVQWFDVNELPLGTSATPRVNDRVGSYRVMAQSFGAPVGAVYGIVSLQITGCAAGEIHYLGALGLFPCGVAQLIQRLSGGIAGGAVWTRGGVIQSPAWGVVVERSNDLGQTWDEVRGCSSASPGELNPLTQTAVFYDYEAAPLTTVLYRARSVAQDENGNSLSSERSPSLGNAGFEDTNLGQWALVGDGAEVATDTAFARPGVGAQAAVVTVPITAGAYSLSQDVVLPVFVNTVRVKGAIKSRNVAGVGAQLQFYDASSSFGNPIGAPVVLVAASTVAGDGPFVAYDSGDVAVPAGAAVVTIEAVVATGSADGVNPGEVWADDLVLGVTPGYVLTDATQSWLKSPTQPGLNIPVVIEPKSSSAGGSGSSQLAVGSESGPSSQAVVFGEGNPYPGMYQDVVGSELFKGMVLFLANDLQLAAFKAMQESQLTLLLQLCTGDAAGEQRYVQIAGVSSWDRLVSQDQRLGQRHRVTLDLREVAPPAV